MKVLFTTKRIAYALPDEFKGDEIEAMALARDGNFEKIAEIPCWTISKISEIEQVEGIEDLLWDWSGRRVYPIPKP